VKLDSLKKSKVFERYNEQIPVKDRELEQLTLFMEKKREIGRKRDK